MLKLTYIWFKIVSHSWCLLIKIEFKESKRQEGLSLFIRSSHLYGNAKTALMGRTKSFKDEFTFGMIDFLWLQILHHHPNFSSVFLSFYIYFLFNYGLDFFTEQRFGESFEVLAKYPDRIPVSCKILFILVFYQRI